MFCVVKSVIKDFGVSQTWPKVKVWQVLCWSLQALAAGAWPMQDWEGHEFTDGLAAVQWSLFFVQT